LAKDSNGDLKQTMVTGHFMDLETHNDLDGATATFYYLLYDCVDQQATSANGGLVQMEFTNL